MRQIWTVGHISYRRVDSEDILYLYKVGYHLELSTWTVTLVVL